VFEKGTLTERKRKKLALGNVTGNSKGSSEGSTDIWGMSSLKMPLCVCVCVRVRALAHGRLLVYK
jgi:hypothetical protein